MHSKNLQLFAQKETIRLMYLHSSEYPRALTPVSRSRSWTETNRVWGDDYLKQEAERFTNSQCVSCQYLLNTDQQMIAGQECACLSHVWRHLLRKTSPNEPGLDKPDILIISASFTGQRKIGRASCRERV